MAGPAQMVTMRSRALGQPLPDQVRRRRDSARWKGAIPAPCARPPQTWPATAANFQTFWSTSAVPPSHGPGPGVVRLRVAMDRINHLRSRSPDEHDLGSQA